MKAESDPARQASAAVGRVPSGLFILTLRHGDMETGMLVSWVQQCSFEPLQVCLALKRDREITRLLEQGSTFALNILDDTQTDMIAHFGRGFAPGQPAFEGLPVSRSDGGTPVLDETLGYLDCRVVSRCPAGDHDLFISEVVGGRLLNEGAPMVHVRKSGSHY